MSIHYEFITETLKGCLSFGWSDEYPVVITGLLECLKNVVPQMEVMDVAVTQRWINQCMHSSLSQLCAEQAVNAELWYPKGRKVSFLKSFFRGGISKLLCVLN